MRSFLKVIFFIPQFLINVIWSLIWSLVKVIAFFAIVIFGFVYYANHSDSQFARDITTTVNNVTNLFNNVSQNGSEGLIDQFSNTSQAKWSKPSATYYIKTTNPTLVEAYQSAIETWNETGVFTFVEGRELVTVPDEPMHSALKPYIISGYSTRHITSRARKTGRSAVTCTAGCCRTLHKVSQSVLGT